jgi:chemotaxis protein histidine kinase CheA
MPPVQPDVGKYTQLFIDETRRHLGTLGEILDSLSSGTTGEDLFYEGRRHTHSIKGMALFEEQQVVADLAYAMEKSFERAAGNGLEESLKKALRDGISLLMTMIGEVERDGSAVSDPATVIAAIE